MSSFRTPARRTVTFHLGLIFFVLATRYTFHRVAFHRETGLTKSPRSQLSHQPHSLVVLSINQSNQINSLDMIHFRNSSHRSHSGTVFKSKENEKNGMDKNVGAASESYRLFSKPRCSRSVSKRFGKDDEKWKKNKKVIDSFLKKLKPLSRKDLSLNADGLAFFAFKKFIVVVEVPPDNPEVCFIYTMVCRLGENDNQAEVLKIAMKLNYMQGGTRGATIGLDGEEVNLCYSCHISGLVYCEFKASLDDFLQTAMEVNGQLDATKALDQLDVADKSHSSI